MINWIDLNNELQLNDIITSSRVKPVVIFKHSTRCGISSMAKRRLERNWDVREEEIELYYLDLIAYRFISNKIAEIFGVRHESPQLLLINNGQAVYNDSHNAISITALRDALNTITV